MTLPQEYRGWPTAELLGYWKVMCSGGRPNAPEGAMDALTALLEEYRLAPNFMESPQDIRDARDLLTAAGFKNILPAFLFEDDGQC